MTSLFGEFLFKVANDLERERALQTRREVYARDWPKVPLSQVVDRADQAAHQLIASTHDGEVIACLRIVPSDQRPFDMEHFISLKSVLPLERSPAEIGRLCVKHGSRYVKSSSFVQLGIFKLAIEFSRGLGTTDLLLTALPKLRNLYRSAGFTEVGVAFEHSTWGPVHVMRLDLVQLFKNDLKPSTSIHRVLKAGRLPNFVV